MAARRAPSSPTRDGPHAALTRAWIQRGWLAWLLWPVSMFFGAAVAVRRWLFQAHWLAATRLKATVVVVGNVVAGGAGKTPVVMALVRHMVGRGWQVGVVSRGYGRRTTDCREVLATSSAQEAGDEPALVKRSTGVPVFVGADRAQAALALCLRYPGTQIVVCDDGLQHYALARDLEICVFDDRGIGNGFLLPAGPLREPWPRPANLVLHTGAQPAFEGGFRAQRQLADHAVNAAGQQFLWAELASQTAVPVVAVAAIGQPEPFFAMLRKRGLTLASAIALPDHYDFDSWECPFDGDYRLICTEKDAVKLWRTHPEALAAPLVVTLDPAFLRRVDTAVEATRLSPPLSSRHGHTPS